MSQLTPRLSLEEITFLTEIITEVSWDILDLSLAIQDKVSCNQRIISVLKKLDKEYKQKNEELLSKIGEVRQGKIGFLSKEKYKYLIDILLNSWSKNEFLLLFKDCFADKAIPSKIQEHQELMLDVLIKIQS